VLHQKVSFIIIITFLIFIVSSFYQWTTGYAGTIAVNILREMQHYGCPPNPICYGGALTACARCGMWDQVEFLLNEMISLGLPLQESILISVINVCRMSAISNSPMYNTNITTSLPLASSYITSAVPSLPSSSSSSSSSSQNLKDWTRAVWLVDKWAPLTANLTESLFTMVTLSYYYYQFIIITITTILRLWIAVKLRTSTKRYHQKTNNDTYILIKTNNYYRSYHCIVRCLH